MKTWNRSKICVKLRFSFPVVIVKFSFFAREFVKKKCHFQSWKRDVDTIFVVISFLWPLPGICAIKSWNREIYHIHVFPFDHETVSRLKLINNYRCTVYHKCPCVGILNSSHSNALDPTKVAMATSNIILSSLFSVIQWLPYFISWPKID